MQTPRRYESYLCDPWMPTEPYWGISKNQAGSFSVGALVSTNNHAHYVPVTFPCDAIVYALRFAAGNGTGNYDLGLYNASLSRLASTGSTAMSAAGVKELALSNLRVRGGEMYYCALALSNTLGQIVRLSNTSAEFRAAHGWGMEASALPLPSTATPISTTAYTTQPLFAFGVR